MRRKRPTRVTRVVVGHLEEVRLGALACTRPARLAGDQADDELAVGLVPGAAVHGAELVDGEGLEAAADAALAVDRAPARVQPDGDGEREEDGREHEQQDGGDRHVQRPAAAAEYLDSPSATADACVERLPASVLLALMTDQRSDGPCARGRETDDPQAARATTCAASRSMT